MSMAHGDTDMNMRRVRGASKLRYFSRTTRNKYQRERECEHKAAVLVHLYMKVSTFCISYTCNMSHFASDINNTHDAA